MTSDSMEKDLIVLAADSQMEFTVRGLLGRGSALGFRNVFFDIYVHPKKDPGCFLWGHDFLRPFYKQYRHAIVMFDREGSGRESQRREDLEAEVEQRLFASGWNDRAVAIVLDPELEIWVWSSSPEVDRVLGWSGEMFRLQEWLHQEGYCKSGQAKPSRPKEAMENALRLVRKGRSSSIFLQLAQRVSVNRCTDPAFLKFKTTIQRWFSGSEGRG